MTLLNEEKYNEIIKNSEGDVDLIFDEIIKILPIFLNKYPLSTEITNFKDTDFKKETKILFKLIYNAVPKNMKEYNNIEQEKKDEIIELFKSIDFVIKNIESVDLEKPPNELIDSLHYVCIFFKNTSDSLEKINKSFIKTEGTLNKISDELNRKFKSDEIRIYIKSILEKKCIIDIIKLKNYKIYISTELSNFNQKIIEDVLKKTESNNKYYENILKLNNAVDNDFCSELSAYSLIQLRNILDIHINHIEKNDIKNCSEPN